MHYAIGLALALGVGCFGRLTGLDRERAFYATVAIVVASYYVLFAAIGGSPEPWPVELLATALFVTVAVIGFKTSGWWVVVALAGHGVFDGFHDLVVTNPGVPPWWPAFCLSYDVGAAAFLAWLLLRRRSQVAPTRARSV